LTWVIFIYKTHVFGNRFRHEICVFQLTKSMQRDVAEDGFQKNAERAAPGRKRNPAISKRVGYQAPFADCERRSDRVTIQLPLTTRNGTLRPPEVSFRTRSTVDDLFRPVSSDHVPPRGGTQRIIACSDEPLLIGKILGHVQQREELNDFLARASPGRKGQAFNQKGG